MFSPFSHGKGPSKPSEEDAKAEPEKGEPKSDELAEMRQQLAAMQSKLEKLSNESK
jgi:polyhydroxyalkanoate synthesis regulator protein